MGTKTITLTETAPGTFQIQGDSGNPFGGATAQTTAMVGPMQTTQTVASGYRATLPDGTQIMFATEADYLKANNYVRSFMQQPGQPIGAAPTVGSAGPMPGMTAASWLRVGAESAETVVGYLQGRALDRRIQELDESLDRLDRARVKLENLRPMQPDLVPVLLEVVDAERECTVTAQQIIEDEISAVDIRTGAGAAKVVGQFLSGNSAAPGAGTGVGTAVAVGAGALGLGLLTSRDADRRRRRGR